VAIGASVAIVLALRAGQLGDLGLHQLAYHLQPNVHRRRQQTVTHLGRKVLQLLGHLSGQPFRKLRPGQVDQANSRHQPQVGRAGPVYV
jgi:hypothetical protein